MNNPEEKVQHLQMTKGQQSANESWQQIRYWSEGLWWYRFT